MFSQINWRYLLRNSPFIYGQNIADAGSVLLLAVLAANFVPPEMYGSYKYLLTLATLASMFSLSGIGATLLRQVANDHGASFTYLAKKLFLSLLLPTALILAGAGYYLLQGDRVFGLSLAIAAICTPFFYTTQLYRPTLNGLQQYQRYALYSSVHAILAAGFMATAFFITNNVIVFVATFFLSHTLLGAYFLFQTHHKHIRSIQQISDTSSAHFATHLSFLNIFSKLANNIDSIIVFQLLGPIMLATYTFSKTPIDQLKAQNKTLAALIAPRFSKYSYQQIRAKMTSKTILLVAAGGLLAFIYWLLAPYIFELLFPQYKNGIMYSQILSLGLLTFPQILYIEAFTALKMKRALYIVRISSAVLRISLIALLTLWFGLLGLVSAIVLTQYLMLLLSASIFHTDILNGILSSYKLNRLSTK